VSETLSARAGNPGRIVLNTFRSAHDPMLQAWLRFRAQLLPELANTAPAPTLPSVAAEGVGQYGVWRMLATNNRELARGAALHASPGLALTDAEALQHASASLTTSVVRGSSPMTHGWVLRRDGVAVLICSRWYESSPEAASAARAARAVLERAEIVRSVSIGTRSGRRQRHEMLPTDSGG
jgi:hypothetical protein